MISDEDLKWFAGALNSAGVGEMATELLQLREEKRKAEEARAKSWERLPKWLQWKATDMDGATFLYENKPKPCRGEWMQPTVTTRVVKFVGPVLGWKDTLEERP